MAAIFNTHAAASADYLRLTSNLGTGDYHFSVGFWFKWDNSGGEEYRLFGITDGVGAGYIYIPTSGVLRLYNLGTIDDSTETLTNDEWVYICYTYYAAGTHKVHLWRNGDSTTDIPLVCEVTAGARMLPSKLIFGADDGTTRGFRGKLSHVRYWNGPSDEFSPGATLTGTDIAAERTSATAVKTSGSILIDNWPLLSNATGDVNSIALTANSITYDADVPSYISSGASAARGMPFGNRSTAFNGGRIFVGPIN